MLTTVDIRYLDDDKWDETKHPRGKGSKGGQFVAKGQQGVSLPSKGQEGEGKTPIGQFVSKRLAEGDTPEQIAEKLTLVLKLHKNQQYINRMLRKLEKDHGLTPGILSKGSVAKPAPAKPTPKPQPQQEIAPLTPQQPASKAEIDALVASKTHQREKDFHSLAWKDATSKFVQLATSVKPLGGGVVTIKGKGAHYDPGWGSGVGGVDHINMPGSDDTTESALSTFRHEYGHKIDWERGKQYGIKHGPYGINGSYQFDGVLRQEGFKLAKAYVDRKNKPTAIYQADVQAAAMKKAGLTPKEIDDFCTVTYQTGLASTDPTHDKVSVFKKADLLGALHHGVLGGSITNCAHSSDASSRLHDFYGPMTMNTMGWGHKKAYYKKAPFYRTAEAFANYVALTQGKHGKIYKALLHATAPKLCAGFDKLLEF